MELNVFNGGLNLLTDSHKINLNECTDVVNADIVSGSVKSIPEKVLYQTNVSPVFLEYNGKVVSANGYTQIAKMHNQLFRSDGIAPRYTDGKFINGILKWYEMGIVNPTTTISAFIAELGPNLVLFTYEEDTTLTGALQSNTEYVYLFIIDGIPTKLTWVSDNSHSAHRVYIDYSNIEGEVSAIYRLVGGSYLGIRDSINDSKTFTDFSISISTYPYENGYKQLTFNIGAIANLFNRITWTGNGGASLNGGVLGTAPSKDLTMNFQDGSHSSVVVDGFYTNIYVSSVLDDIRTKGMKKFRVTHRFGYNVIAEIEITHDGYSVITLNASLVNTPRKLVLDKSEGYANGIGDDLLSVVADKDLQGDFEYAFTFVSDSGVETSIGPISSIIHSDGQAINIIIPEMEQPADDVNHINLYRRNTGLYSGGTSFLSVKQFALDELPLMFTDNTKIEDLGKLMPARTIVPLPTDALFFTEHRGRLFCATKGYFDRGNYTPSDDNEYPTDVNNGDIFTISGLDDEYTYKTGTLADEVVTNEYKIIYLNGDWSLHLPDDDLQDYSKYFTILWSNLGRPNEWDSLNFLNVSHPVTGLCSTSNGLIVYSKTTTYIILNAETSSFNYRKLSGSLGCIDSRSIQEINGVSICASADGISIADGGKVTLVSYSKLGSVNMEDNILSSAVVGDDYFLLLRTGYILRLNLLTMTYSYIEGINYVGLGSMYGKLFAVADNNLYEIAYKAYNDNHILITNNQVSISRTFTYRTGNVSDNAISNLKEYDKVRINLQGSGFCSIYIDDNLVINTEPIGSGVTMIGIPNELNSGYSIQFEISGIGTLHSIEYSVIGRTNA